MLLSSLELSDTKFSEIENCTAQFTLVLIFVDANVQASDARKFDEIWGMKESEVPSRQLFKFEQI